VPHVSSSSLIMADEVLDCNPRELPHRYMHLFSGRFIQRIDRLDGQLELTAICKRYSSDIAVGWHNKIIA
jgi:hypothetical protein